MQVCGGCFCGALRYRADEVFDAGYCHCSICRRISGAAAVCWFSVRQEHFHLLQGEPAALASSEHFTRYFCPRCGTHVYGRDNLPAPLSVGSRLVSAMLGTLDEPELVRPAVHQWWSSRMPWVEEAAGLLKFDTGAIVHPDKRPGGAAPAEGKVV